MLTLKLRAGCLGALAQCDCDVGVFTAAAFGHSHVGGVGGQRNLAQNTPQHGLQASKVYLHDDLR